jgi:hypothetical protein
MLMRTPARWVRPKRLQPPGFIVPCQPTLASKVPAGDGCNLFRRHFKQELSSFETDTPHRGCMYFDVVILIIRGSESNVVHSETPPLFRRTLRLKELQYTVN